MYFMETFRALLLFGSLFALIQRMPENLVVSINNQKITINHDQPSSTTINHYQPLQRMPGGDVGIWDLAVSINNQRIINEDDSGNKQKEASLIFIGETKDNQQPHFF